MSHKEMDHLYMKRCFDLANMAGKEVKRNPKVGAVLVYNGKIIGEGFHQKSGGSHAEVHCLESVDPSDRSLIPSSTLYVSLEPCCHHGKTPPCTSLILENKIRDVRISVNDPSEKVGGKGIELLRSNGIKVRTGILEKEGKKLIRPFAVRQKYKRPYIILKIVKSSDNYIGISGKQVWLSSSYTDVLTHKWRSEIDAILVGTNTALNDRPSLTTRNYPGEHPIKMIIDRHHKIKIDNNPILNGAFMYFSYNKRPDIEQSLQHIINPGSELESILQSAYQYDIQIIMIEGGSKIIQSFYNEGYWDEARVITTPSKIGEGIRAINIQGKLIKECQIAQDKVQIIHHPDR